MLGACLLLLTQGQSLDLSAVLERSRVAVGEEFVYTIKAIGHSTAPFRVELPAFDGLALLERTERTDVVVGTNQITRAFTLELRLRAEQVGTWTISPIRVEQGEASGFTPEETVFVTSASSGSSSGLDPDLLALIPRVPPPRLGRPTVYLVTSDQQVYAGDQINVLTAAWLPRSLRLRLRQAPTLTPPALASVWSTPRHAVPGAVASRGVEGETYDLYVSFQTVYPLNPGTLSIPAARLAWVQPSARNSSADRRESVESAPVSLSVQPLPDAGRPAAFAGPVAHDLRIEYELGASSGRAGVALPVAIVVSGAGNLPLWPLPQVPWPATVRVYQEGTENMPRLMGLRMGGSKTFRFGIVPDSAGSLSLPPLEYQYFDPSSVSYRSAHAPAIVVPVLEPPPVTDRRNPLPLEEPEYQGFAERLVGLPPIALTLLAGFPLLLVLGAGLWRRRVPRAAPRTPAGSAAAQLEALVEALVPPGTPAAPRKLVAALREAGLTRADAERLVQLHLALEADRFGPQAAGNDATSPALSREVESALATLPRRIRRVAGLAACWLAAMAGSGRAQSGMEHYARGEYAAAARAFRAEVETARPTAARWYDLAASEYLAHRDAHAVAALLAARARAPRDPRVRVLWSALAREHEQLRRAAYRWPLSAEELLALALLGLWLGSAVYVVLYRQRSIWVALFVIAGASGVTGFLLRARRNEPRAVLAGGVSLRISPHGLAPERGTLPGFSVVRLERRLGSWWLVRAANGAEGWVPAEILALGAGLN
jgi:oxygen tolerance protein BatD